jgi:hypothetical protein
MGLGISLSDEKVKKKEEDPMLYMIGNENIADEVNHQQLDDLLNAFINSLGTQPSLQSVLKENKPVLKDGFKIEFKLYTEAQEKDLLDHGEALLMKLRTTLNNYQLKIATTIIQTQAFNATGPNDKYLKMVEQNPNLKKLKEQLNLEIEF